MNSEYSCPPPHDGEIKITFDKVLCPTGMKSYELLTPSVPNPKSYSNVKLIQKNLGWHGLDVIKCWNDKNDGAIYLGRWDEEEEEISFVSGKRKIKVKEIARAKDGGTQSVIDRKGNKYFIDNRLGSETKGSIYDKYPGEEGAIMLDVILEVVKNL